MKYNFISILIVVLMLLGSFYLKAQNRFTTYKSEASQLNDEKTIWIYTPKSSPFKIRKQPYTQPIMNHKNNQQIT
jgi:hypothetical protein